MDPDQEHPQVKRVRLSEAPLQPQGASIGGCTQVAPPTAGPSSTTGATIALPSTATAAPQHAAAKPSGSIASTAGPASTSAVATARAAAGPCTSSSAAPSSKPPNFIANAHETVHFRAVSAPTAEGLAAEIAAGGQPVTVEFLHQHFGDAEQIRGYSGLKITIWVHVRTYHTWVDIQFAAKRPGADKLGPIFDGAFPAGYCRSQVEFVTSVTATAAAMPDLMTLGDCVGTVPLPPMAYGVKTAAPPTAPPAETAADDDAGSSGGSRRSRSGCSRRPMCEVSVRRFQVRTAPAEVKALHARLEPLLLFTIDGAQFIDDDDPQWEMILPVLRAEDGGCLVLGLTTLFNFFAYPDSCRLRVSQVLVLSPWQGLGLGKALLKLSYDLAKSRRCADLTVEDPTPNLQRVREKLEVEMMRGLPWVAQQARKCLDAVVRGDTNWPAWRQQQQQQQGEKREGQSQEEGQRAGHQEEVPAGATAVANQGQGQGQGQGPQGQGGGLAAAAAHPLLATHAFFAALGAVPAQGMALPEEVAATAAAARGRQRLAAAEAAATAAEVEAAGPSGALGTAAADIAMRGSGAGGGGAATAAIAATAAAAALVPSSSFVSAICSVLKVHRWQIRTVWEAVLWCEPGALNLPGVRPALEQLIESRLEAQYFSSVGRMAAAKQLIDVKCAKPVTGGGGGGGGVATTSDGADEETDFFMYRPWGGAAAAAAGASGSGGDAAAVATGRLNLTQVTADDKARRLEEMLEERRQQLDSLAAVLGRAIPKQQPQ